MAIEDTYLESLRARLEDSKKYLEPLEAGTLHIGTRSAGGDWIDVTQEWINRERDTIATYERLIALEEARRCAGQVASTR